MMIWIWVRVPYDSSHQLPQWPHWLLHLSERTKEPMMRARSSAATIGLPTRTLSRFRYRRQSIPDPDDVNTDIRTPAFLSLVFPVRSVKRTIGHWSN